MLWFKTTSPYPSRISSACSCTTYSDSEIAQGYAAASTKTTCIINGSLAPYFKKSLVDFMKSHLFSIAIDGYNDTGVEKMNPITVRYFDSNEGRVQTRFFDICLTKGK